MLESRRKSGISEDLHVGRYRLLIADQLFSRHHDQRFFLTNTPQLENMRAVMFLARKRAVREPKGYFERYGWQCLSWFNNSPMLALRAFVRDICVQTVIQ